MERQLTKVEEWLEFRRSVFERDEYTCQECKEVGKVGRLSKSISMWRVCERNIDEKELIDTNYLTLCRACAFKRRGTLRKYDLDKPVRVLEAI